MLVVVGKKQLSVFFEPRALSRSWSRINCFRIVVWIVT